LGKVFDSIYSTGERDRFRTRLERTADNRTEIYLTHRGLEETVNRVTASASLWVPRPSDPELEAEFLNRLLVRLGVDRTQAQAVTAAAAPAAAGSAAATAAAPQRARLVEESAQQRYIELDEPFDRAWRRVSLALDRGGFTVEDRDRSKGLYFVRYIDPEAESRASGEKPGFFSRLFSSKKTALSSRQYRVSLSAAGEKSRLSVTSREGAELSSEADREVQSKVLALLLDQLKS
jgi:outer membrane protein assembly factor BamC